MAIHAQVAFTFFATRICTVKDAVMLFPQMWCTLQSHRTTNVVICSINCFATEPQMRQKVKSWVHHFIRRNSKDISAKFRSKGPLIEHKAYIKCGWQSSLNFVNLSLPKAMANQ